MDSIRSQHLGIFAWILPAVLALILALGASTSASAAIEPQYGPVDGYTPSRIDSVIDILTIRAMERSTSPEGDWEFDLFVDGFVSTINITSRGALEYGINLQYGDEPQDKYLLVSVFDPTKTNFLDQERTELRSSTGTVLCSGTLFSDVTVLTIGGKSRIAYSAKLSISKTCLPSYSSVEVSAYALNLESGIVDLLPDSKGVVFSQPWISNDSKDAGPYPVPGEQGKHGPLDGEFSAWTKLVNNGEQIKFYAKYPQLNKKIQFMVQNATGAYEELAWLRITKSDLSENNSYLNLQNHVYLIRTLDLVPGKNRTRILVDGEIVWGTKTYTKKR
jgi:hypothetical protein